MSCTIRNDRLVWTFIEIEMTSSEKYPVIGIHLVLDPPQRNLCSTNVDSHAAMNNILSMIQFDSSVCMHRLIWQKHSQFFIVYCTTTLSEFNVANVAYSLPTPTYILYCMQAT